MNLREAQRIIAGKDEERFRAHGFRVHFEVVEGSMLRTDYFPDAEEPPLDDEEEAWALAESFARKTVGQFVNIYVVHYPSWVPVRGYERRMIENRR